MILSGCGVFDGSEIHESAYVMLHLSAKGAAMSLFAPNMDQAVVKNHLTGEQKKEARNVLEESARIGRGVHAFV